MFSGVLEGVQVVRSSLLIGVQKVCNMCSEGKIRSVGHFHALKGFSKVSSSNCFQKFAQRCVVAFDMRLMGF